MGEWRMRVRREIARAARSGPSKGPPTAGTLVRDVSRALREHGSYLGPHVLGDAPKGILQVRSSSHATPSPAPVGAGQDPYSMQFDALAFRLQFGFAHGGHIGRRGTKPNGSGSIPKRFADGAWET